MSSSPDPMDLLAQDFLRAWQEAHGVKSGQAYALSGSDHLAIIIEDSFSQAERKLAEGQTGEMLLRQYAVELLNQICDQMAERIEKTTSKKALFTDLSVNTDTDQVIFTFKLNTLSNK